MYFPNGTSALMFQEDHCFHCRHWIGDEHGNEYCPIMDAHFAYSYTAKDDAKHILDMLISEETGKCVMFLAEEKRCRGTIEMFPE